jgi:hypothetical protein
MKKSELTRIINEELKKVMNEASFVQKVLGKTKSGKEVKFPNQGNFKDFTLADHQDAVRIYGDKIKGRFNATPLLKAMTARQRQHSDWVSELDGTNAKNKTARANKPHDNDDFYKNKFQKDGSKPWDNIA